MNLKYCLLFLFVFVFILTCEAQITITGSVADQRARPIPNATIKVLRLPDSSLARALSADSAGKFRIGDLISTNYLIIASAVGYVNTSATIIPGGRQSIHVSLQLSPGTAILSNVTVKGKKKTITHSAGKTVLNVEQSKLAQSKTVFELLKNLPGVTISKQGEIKLKGKSGVQVMIDGEPVKLGESQLKDMLSALPASTLKNIEVIDDPPISMDAAGSGGVINIQFNKKVIKGWNGSLASGIGWGRFIKTDHSAMVNYGNEKWNVSSLLSYGYDKTWTEDNSLRNQATSGMGQANLATTKNSSYLARVSIDRYFTEKDILGAVISYGKSPGRAIGEVMSEFYSNARLDSVIRQHSRTSYVMQNKEASVKYKHNFTDKEYFSLSLNLSKNIFEADDRFRLFGNNTTSPVGKYRNTYPSNINTYSFKGDYRKDLTFGSQKTGLLEAGFKSAYSEINNTQAISFTGQVPKEIATGQPVDNRVREQIHAGYASLELKDSKWSLQAGFRVEYTDLKGNALLNNSSVRQQYLSFFPNFRIARKFGDSYRIGFYYDRRINRPTFDQLNPAVKVIDAYTIETGNPGLQPQMVNTFKIEQEFFSLINLSAGVSIHKNPISTALLQQSSTQTKYTTVNFGRQQEWFADISFPIQVAPWWENYYGAYFNWNIFETGLPDKTNTNKIASFGIFANNNFNLPHDLGLELSGWYNGAESFGNMKFLPFGEVSAGINKSFFAKKLTAAIALSDIFYTSKYSGELLTGNSEKFKSVSRYESRVVKFTLTWKFGKTQRRAELMPDEQAPAVEKGVPKRPSARSGSN